MVEELTLEDELATEAGMLDLEVELLRATELLVLEEEVL
jgi:hypothetical protein